MYIFILYLYSGFNLPSFVGTAFKQLKTDVQSSTDVTIGKTKYSLILTFIYIIKGKYNTTLQFTQAAVPTITDNSLNLVLPILAQPIVQKIVAGMQ